MTVLICPRCGVAEDSDALDGGVTSGPDEAVEELCDWCVSIDRDRMAGFDYFDEEDR